MTESPPSGKSSRHGFECPVCLESLNSPAGDVTRTPLSSSGNNSIPSIEPRDICATHCGHLFHCLCLEKWFDRESRECPSCRRNLSPQEITRLYPNPLTFKHDAKTVSPEEFETLKTCLESLNIEYEKETEKVRVLEDLLEQILNDSLSDTENSELPEISQISKSKTTPGETYKDTRTLYLLIDDLRRDQDKMAQRITKLEAQKRPNKRSYVDGKKREMPAKRCTTLEELIEQLNKERGSNESDQDITDTDDEPDTPIKKGRNSGEEE